MKDTFNQVILWLSGKKSIISACLAVIIAYLATAGIIDNQLSTAILAIVNILFGGAKLVENNAIENNTPLGSVLKERMLK